MRYVAWTEHRKVLVLYYCTEATSINSILTKLIRARFWMFPVIECSVFVYNLLLAFQTFFTTHSLIENFDVDIFYIFVFMKVDLGEKKICEKKPGQINHLHLSLINKGLFINYITQFWTFPPALYGPLCTKPYTLV